MSKTSQVRQAVQRQRGLCFFCHAELGCDVTVEHLKAKSNGGGNNRSNIRAAHRNCNTMAGNLTVEQKLKLSQIGKACGKRKMMGAAKMMRREQSRLLLVQQKRAEAKARKRSAVNDNEGVLRTISRRVITGGGSGSA